MSSGVLHTPAPAGMEPGPLSDWLRRPLAWTPWMAPSGISDWPAMRVVCSMPRGVKSHPET